MNRFIIALLLLTFGFSAYAVEKRYVSDKLWLQLRSGPSTEYRIIKALQSGEHLIFIEESDDGKYTKVKTDKGLEGYVLTQFLEDQPVAKEKLIYANQELDKIKAELKTAQQQRDQFKADAAKLKSERSGLGKENSSLEQELEHIKKISANALELDVKYKELVQANHTIEVRLESLTTENAQLRDTRQQTYILYGGGLVVLGILLGLILPALKAKRKNSWA